VAVKTAKEYKIAIGLLHRHAAPVFDYTEYLLMKIIYGAQLLS